MRYLLTVLLIVTLAIAYTELPSDNSDQSDTQATADTPTGDQRKSAGKEILGPGLGEFILIDGGEFTMGCDDGEQDDEKPEHRVELSSFFVGRTPVTNRQFVQFLNESDIKPEEYLSSQVSWANGIELADAKWVTSEGCENDAACTEDWVLSKRYCKWLSRKTDYTCRLPTEAEWEYVCRGKEGRKFPWGNDLGDLDNRIWAWRHFTGPKKVPVGSFPKGATPDGVCDLIGYMDEVCSDWYDPEYYARSPKKNPAGPDKPKPYKNAKVTRGGLQRRYTKGSSLVRLFRDSQFFGILPSSYLPRGSTRGKAAPPEEPRFVYGRLGLRVVVECETRNAAKDLPN